MDALAFSETELRILRLPWTRLEITSRHVSGGEGLIIDIRKLFTYSFLHIFVNTRTGNCYFAFHGGDQYLDFPPVRSFSLIERKYAVLAVVDGFKA